MQIMSNKEENKKENKKERFLKGTFRFFYRTGIIILLLLLIISTSITILLNLKPVRQFAISELENLVANNINGEFTIYDITISPFYDIKLDRPLLTMEQDTIFAADYISLRLSFLDLLDDRIIIEKLYFDEPKLNMIRGSDSLWNVEKLPKSLDNEVDTAQGEPPDLYIKFADMMVNEGEFYRYDSLSNNMEKGKFDPNKLNISKIKLDLFAEFFPKKQDFYIKIIDFSFDENNSNFSLHKFTSDFRITNEYVDISEMKIKTDSIEIALDYKMEDINVFEVKDEKDFQKAKMILKADANNFSMEELKKFSPTKLPINGTYSFKIDAGGDFAEFNINEIEILYGETQIFGNGIINELSSPEKLNYQFNFDGSSASQIELGEMIDEIKSNELPNFGIAKISNLLINGSQDTISVEFDFDSELGKLKGIAGIAPNRSIINYSAKVKLENFDIAKINKQSPNAKISGGISLQGSGIEPKSMAINTNVNLYNSEIEGKKIDSLTMRLNLEKGFIALDTLHAIISPETSEPYFGDEYISSFDAGGWIDLFNNINPEYNLILNFNHLNLSSILDNDELPKSFGGSIEVNASGFHLDSLKGKIISNISTLAFEDKMLLPIKLEAVISRYADKERSVNISSDILSANLNGKFSFTDLQKLITIQAKSVTELIDRRMSDFRINQYQTDSLDIAKIDSIRIDSFPEIDGKFSLNITDISPLQALMDNLEINANAKLDFSIYSSKKLSYIKIDSMAVNSFSYLKDSMMIKSTPLLFNGVFSMSLQDSIPYFNKLMFEVKESGKMLIANVLLDHPNFYFDFDGESLEYDISTTANKEYLLDAKGKISFLNSNINFSADSLLLGFQDKFYWRNDSALSIDINSKGFDFKQFALKRDSAEVIKLSGILSENKAHKITATIKNFPLKDIYASTGNEGLKGLNGTLDSAYLQLDGSLNDPQLRFNSSITNIGFKGFKLGNLYSNIKNINGNTQGYAFLINDKIKNNDTLFSVLINSFPLFIGLDSNRTFFEIKGLTDIDIFANNLPLKSIEPLAEGTSQINGRADAAIKIVDNQENSFSFKGNLEVKEAEFVLDATNIKYAAEAEFNFDEKEINLVDLFLRNTNTNGYASGSGFVSLSDGTPNYLDFKFTANKLTVLSDETEASMPDLYGNMSVSTGRKPIRFYGTMEEPNLEGDIIVDNASLKIGEMQSGKQVTQRLDYKYIEAEDKIIIRSYSEIDSAFYLVEENKEVEKQESTSPEFADNINYDINIGLKRDISVLIDLGTFGKLFANVSTPIGNNKLIYRKDRRDEEATLIGNLIVRDNSTLQFIKKFNISGEISFPTGDINDPAFNLIAIHRGQAPHNGEQRNYSVTMNIQGTMNNPEINFSYSINDIEAAGAEEEIKADALSLLAFGVKKGEVESNEVIRSNALALASSLASKQLTDIFSQSGVIQSADIDFNSQESGDDSDLDPNLKLTGSILGANVVISGSATEFHRRNEITIEMPVSVWLENQFWNNFIFQASYSTDNTNNRNRTQDAMEWEFKIKYGRSF